MESASNWSPVDPQVQFSYQLLAALKSLLRELMPNDSTTAPKKAAAIISQRLADLSNMHVWQVVFITGTMARWFRENKIKLQSLYLNFWLNLKCIDEYGHKLYSSGKYFITLERDDKAVRVIVWLNILQKNKPLD